MGAAAPRPQVGLFYSYSHKDEGFREELEAHLSALRREGLIAEWHDRRIAGGERWDRAINDQLEAARVVLLLVSADFLASDYCWGVEVERALERGAAGEATVVPVVLRPVDWHRTPIGQLQALPRDGKAITTWPNRDEAWTDVARGIRRIVEGIGAPAAAAPRPSAVPTATTSEASVEVDAYAEPGSEERVFVVNGHYIDCRNDEGGQVHFASFEDLGQLSEKKLAWEAGKGAEAAHTFLVPEEGHAIEYEIRAVLQGDPLNVIDSRYSIRRNGATIYEE